MGCGRTWNQEPTTPEYFLNCGASKVIGVEIWDNERIWYEENVPDERLTVITDLIDTVGKLKTYIKTYNPQAIKCDIEGYESLFVDFNEEDFNGVDEMAIEYHNSEMRKMIHDNYLYWGFNSIDGFSMDGFKVEEQGVIHIKK